MKHILRIILSLFLAFQAAEIFAQGANDSAILLKDLQTSYAKLQKAISDTSLRGFIDAKIPNPDIAKGEAEFKEVVGFLKQMYPAMTSGAFLEVKRVGDIAGYYYSSDEDGENFVTVRLTKFKNINGVWKVGDTGSSCEPLQSKAGKKAQIRKMIDSSGTLALK